MGAWHWIDILMCSMTLVLTLTGLFTFVLMVAWGIENERRWDKYFKRNHIC